MEDNYKFAALMHWIATSPSAVPDGTGSRTPRNDGYAHHRHCEPKAWQSSAFSLIELLISLIIISLIVSSFIPIITKKIKHHNATISSGVMNCKKFDEKCMLCDKKECTLCTTQINLLDGQYVDPKTSCEVKQCPNNCAKCDANGCLQCREGYRLNNNKKCINYTDVPCLEIGNICAAKFNAGDPGGLSIEGLVEIKNTVTSGASAAGNHTLPICWKGNTANDCDVENGGYSGCNRTVCTWYAAKKICEHHGWRLPTVDELSLFSAYSIGKGADGLQMCEDYGGYLSARCNDSKNCPGSKDGYCYASDICTNEENGHYFYLARDQWVKQTERNASYTFSVRCIRDL